MNLFTTKNILIIGATGKVAEAVIRLFRRDETVRLKLFSGSIPNVITNMNGMQYYKVDYFNYNDFYQICNGFKPDVIINLAAMTNVDACEDDLVLAWSLNVDLPKHLAELSSTFDAKFIHISTDYIFDGHDGPYNEHDICNPISQYGKTKLLGEFEALKHKNTTILRTNVVYGYSEQGKSDFVTWVIDKGTNNESFNIVDDQYSNPTFTDDIARAINRVIEKDFTGILNVGGYDYCSRIDFTKTICDVFGLDKNLITPISTQSLNQKAPRPLKGGLKIDKLIHQLNINPLGIREGLERLKGYMNEHNKINIQN